MLRMMHCGMIMNTNSTEVVLVDSLPPFRLFADIIRAFSRPSDSWRCRELCDAIKHEPTIAARLIGVANSAYYNSGGQPVSSVERAIVKLGFRQTQAVLLHMVLTTRFDGARCPAFLPQRYWLDAMMVAHCSAHVITSEGSGCDWQQVFTIGLLHNIGLLLLVDQFPVVVGEVIVARQKCNALRSRFGEDQYELGSRLLAHWGLPAEVWNAIGLISANRNGSPESRIIATTKALVDHRYHGDELTDSCALALSEQETLLKRMDEIYMELVETVELLVA